MRKEVGERDLRAILNILIVEVVEFFNVGKTMNQTQVNQTIELIIEDFGFLKPDDFKLCFKNARKGLYGNGKLYDRIDGQIFFEWLNQYKNDRMTASETLSLKQHAEHKRTEKHELTEDQLKNIKLLKDNFTKWVKENEAKPTPKTKSAIVSLISVEDFEERFNRNKHIFNNNDLEKMINSDFKDSPEIVEVLKKELNQRKI